MTHDVNLNPVDLDGLVVMPVAETSAFLGTGGGVWGLSGLWMWLCYYTHHSPHLKVTRSVFKLLVNMS